MNTLRPHILIIYPYPNLDTNPTMAFLLDSLAERKIPVHILLKESEGAAAPNSFGNTIHLKALPSAFFESYRASLRGLPIRIARKLLWRKGYPLRSWRFDPVLFGLLEAQRYSVIVGVDPHGIVLADSLNRWAKKPLVYMSFEIMFGEEVAFSREEAVKRRERASCQRTSVVLIQDEERAEIFSCETSFPRDKMVLVPNASPPQEVVKSNYLRQALGIPADHRIVLLCGTLDAWSSRDELAEMVSYWPLKYCLVVHSRLKVHGIKARYLDQLRRTGRIYLSAQPVGRNDLTALIASADFGLASYKPIPDHWTSADNLYHLGLASGKISSYAMCGLPILASSLPIFEREFVRYDCGKVYRRLSDTGQLLVEMEKNYPHHSEEARRFYRERLNPVGGMRHFCDQLLALASGKGELPSPGPSGRSGSLA